MFGIMSSRPWEAVNVVLIAPPCSAPWRAPAAPPSDCIWTTVGRMPNTFFCPLPAHSSASSAIVELGVMG